MIILYHGSNVSIKNIDLTKSSKGKDFGCGFYLNPNYEQAHSMAQTKVDLLEIGNPIVTSFEFDLEGAQKDGLNVKRFDDYSEEWAEFVVLNRKNKSNEQAHNYDIVIGPIADDKVGLQVRLFAEGTMDIDKLISRIKYYGDKSIQYFFSTENSLNYLRRIR